MMRGDDEEGIRFSTSARRVSLARMFSMVTG